MNKPVDCACVIHGDQYSWQYVENLYHMLQRNLTSPIRLHVFTEPGRAVPAWAIHHPLELWPGIEGRKKAWWYKMQLFNPDHGISRLLYFDLDIAIVKNIDWVVQLDPTYFWAIRDFLHIWKPSWVGINSSMMYWDCDQFSYLWKQFRQQTLMDIMKKYSGDQDWISAHLNPAQLKYFDSDTVKSWRWQILDGGIDPGTGKYISPGTGSNIAPPTSVVVFHGNPKPQEIQDPAIAQLWCGQIDK